MRAEARRHASARRAAKIEGRGAGGSGLGGDEECPVRVEGAGLGVYGLRFRVIGVLGVMTWRQGAGGRQHEPTWSGCRNQNTRAITITKHLVANRGTRRTSQPKPSSLDSKIPNP